MSLKVSKGQKITAVHTNKIVDAICKLGHTPIDNNPVIGTIQPCVQIPAFSLCWYQHNENSIVVYNNTQGNPDNILFLNNEPVPYCSFGYQLPTDACSYLPIEKLEGDGISNASYLAVMTIDSACASDPTVILVRKEPLHSEGDTSSNCSDSGNPQLLSEGETPTEGEESEEEPKILYTFSCFECVQSVWPCAEVIGTYPIGKYSNFGIKQIQHGLILASDTDYIWADSEIPELQISSMQMFVHKDEVTQEISTYIQLFDAQKGFDEPIPRDHEDLAGQPQCLGLRTVLLYCGQYGTNVSGSCEAVDTTQGTFVRYGAAEEFYILNDHEGIEPYNFVTPKHIATYEHITIGCASGSICGDTPCSFSSGDTTDGDDASGSGDMATIYFSKPLVVELEESEEAPPSIVDPPKEAGEETDTGLSGNIGLGDLIFTVCDNGNGAPLHGDWEGQFKTFIPTTVSAGDYMDVLEWKNVYTVYGPAITLKYVDIPGCSSVSGDGVYEPTAIFVPTKGDDVSSTPLHWELYIDRSLSAGNYIKVEDYKINGPEIILECLNGITGDIKYECEAHAWYLNLCVLDTDSEISSTTVSAGDYIKVSETTTTVEDEEEGLTITNREFKVDGPAIDISFYSACDDMPAPASDSGETGEDINNDIYFKAPTATYNEDDHVWNIKIAPPQPLSEISAELSGIGGDNHCLSAGNYINIEEVLDPVLTYVVNGPEMCVCITNSMQCEALNPMTAAFSYANDMWTLNIEADAVSGGLTTELSAGDYINIDESTTEEGNTLYTVNGPEMCVCVTNSSQCDKLNPFKAAFNFEEDVWTLNIEADAVGGGLTTEVSAGDYIHVDSSETADGNPLYTVHGPAMCVCVTNSSQCDKLNPITASFAYDNDIWTLNIEANSTGTDLTAGDYITIDEGKINGAGITIACTETVKGTANYNNGSWELNLNATLEDIEIPNGVCIAAGNNITVAHATANDVDTYTVTGPSFSIGTAKGIDATITQNGIDYVLDLCASTGIEYNAGNYITIDGNNNINGSGIVIGTTKGITASATHANNTWTLNLEADTAKAGNYITIGTDGSINGSGMAVNAKGIDASFSHSNGTWTLNLCAAEVEEGSGVPSVNGIEDAVTITSTSLNVTTSGNTITIEDPNGPNVVYTFDPEWFCVSGTSVTINSAKVECIGQDVAIKAYSTITPVTTTVLDTTDNKGVITDIVATVTNAAADYAAVTIDGVPRNTSGE